MSCVRCVNEIYLFIALCVRYLVAILSTQHRHSKARSSWVESRRQELKKTNRYRFAWSGDRKQAPYRSARFVKGLMQSWKTTNNSLRRTSISVARWVLWRRTLPLIIMACHGDFSIQHKLKQTLTVISKRVFSVVFGIIPYHTYGNQKTSFSRAHNSDNGKNLRNCPMWQARQAKA